MLKCAFNPILTAFWKQVSTGRGGGGVNFRRKILHGCQDTCKEYCYEFLLPKTGYYIITIYANKMHIITYLLALNEVMTWITKNRLVLNSDKTCVMVIGSRDNLKKIESFNVYINTILLNRVHSTKCLGVLIDDELNWSSHVDMVIKISQRNISVTRRARTYLPQNSLKLLYNSLVLPHMDYCSAVRSNRYQSETTQLRKVQKRAARLIMNETYATPSAELFKNLKWMTPRETFWI